MPRGDAGSFQIWPGLAAPVGLTVLLTIAAWLFAGKVEADRDAAAAAARRLESMARREASDLAAAASDAADEFVAAKLAARRAQENNLRVEAKGVMDSVCRFLAASLENSRKRSSLRREVGSFPSGFEGVRRYLEIMPRDDGVDAARDALEANTPELATLLPAGYALVVVEDHAREMLAVGGVGSGENALSVSTVRDMVFDDGTAERRWTLRLDVSAPDQNPLPAAKDVAEFLGRRFGGVRQDRMAWRGWLLGGGGEIAASFPAEATVGGSAPPYLEPAGEWKLLDGGELVWLERRQSVARRSDAAGPAWDVGVSVSIAAPPLDPTLFEALRADVSWAATIAGLALLSLAAWVWFARGFLSGSRSGAARRETAKTESVSAARKRLVRDPEARRTIPEDGEVIVADIGEAGKVTLSVPPPAFMPTGSLARLQAMHRGRTGLQGSRILDQAQSPLLREMAARVRPRLEARPLQRPAAPQAQRPAGVLPTMKQGTVTGWNKVAE